MAERSGGGESFLTVLIALAANAAIAVAKTIAAALTGSASITAEAAHSWADAGNEVFLLIADRRSARPPDAEHPLGYGRDAYVWSLFAAVGVFTVGAVVSVQHGIAELGSREGSEHAVVAYVVLAVSFVLEGISFVRSLQQVRRSAARAGEEVLEHVIRTSDPTVRAVFFEDAAALIGLVLAALGVLLHQLTGQSVWDAAGSILVGVVLGAVALLLIQVNRRFLIGQSVPADTRAAALRVIESDPDVGRVTGLYLEFIGPSRVFVVAAVDLTGDEPEHRVAERLAAIAARIEERPEVVRAVLTLSTPDAAALAP